MEPENHASHGHHTSTGFRWLDISLALSAFFISLVSLSVAIMHGKTMDRLVASNSYPNVEVALSNNADLLDGKGMQPAINVALSNSGIGPARLRSVKMTYKGKAITTLPDLLVVCCTNEVATSQPRPHFYYSGDVRGNMLPAGKLVNLFTWPKATDDPRWERLDVARQDIQVSVCYCSVFEECFVRDSARTEPEVVDACPVPSDSYFVGR